MSNFNERKNFMFMKRTTIFIFILLQFTLAQAPNKYRMAGTGVILGEVIHADTGVAIEYASVSLISKKSNEVVTGQLTDGRGVFVFQELKDFISNTPPLISPFSDYKKLQGKVLMYQKFNSVKTSYPLLIINSGINKEALFNR